MGCREKTVANSSQYDKNRIDILRLMLTCFSEALYHNPDTYDPCSSLWLEVATSSDVPYAEITFCSLMNVVLGWWTLIKLYCTQIVTIGCVYV